jgi:hypothetical protein
MPDTEQVAGIFKAVKALLNRRGFALAQDPCVKHYPLLAKTHRAGKRGELEVAVQLSGRHIEVLFFQNVHNVENSNGGRYDFDKLARMPYLLRQRANLEMRKVEQLVTRQFGAILSVRESSFPHPDGITAREFIEQRMRSSGHFKPALGRADWHADYNRTSGDACLLEHGMPVYFRDSRGRWNSGTAYYNLNNMWWVEAGRYAVRNLGSFQLYVNKPANLRAKDNAKRAAARIHELIITAVKDEDFLRAQQLKEVRDRRAAALAASAAQAAAAGLGSVPPDGPGR